MQYEACDREIGSDGFDEVSVEANTRDIGLAISIFYFLEGRTFSIHHENDDGGTLDPVTDAAIEAIDASDPNNLVLMCEKRTTLHRPHHRRRLMRHFWGLVSAVLSAGQGARMPLTRRAREKSEDETCQPPSRRARVGPGASRPCAPRRRPARNRGLQKGLEAARERPR